MPDVPSDEEFRAYDQGVISEFRAAGEERERLYRMVSDGTSAYEKNTGRVFPVVVLEGVPAPA